MACGTPVVATRAGALTEVLSLTEGGVLAERDDPDSIARGVRTLLENTEARAMMAKRGRERVLETLVVARWPRRPRTSIRKWSIALTRASTAPLDRG